MIYNRFGAQVDITSVEQRTVYSERLPGEYLIHEDGPPANPKGEVEAIPGCWYVKATLASPYHDGSGTIGEPMRDGQWISANEFVADDGIREIHQTCEKIALQAA